VIQALPLYEYRCKSCGHLYEKIQKVNDEPDTACPKCGGEVMRPLTAPAFQFKGAGWYVNDYASKSSSSSGSEKPASESSSESKTESKTESKPAESKPAGESTSSSSAAASASKPASSSGKE
jgi:putative FmdB family regulatory protein